jgi:hypothetical protein
MGVAYWLRAFEDFFSRFFLNNNFFWVFLKDLAILQN